MNHQCYVVTDERQAVVQMPSVVAEFHKAHLARLQRFKVAAVGEGAIAASKVDDRLVEILETAWKDRQKAIPIPKANWFSIVSETVVATPKGPLLEDIQRVACKYFSVLRNDMLSPRRDIRISYPRHVVMYLAKSLTQKSYPEIGRRLGGRDHTTIIHGCRKIEASIRSDWMVAYDVAHVEAML